MTESVDERYEPQNPQTVKIEADKTATVTFKNVLKKGDLKIIKTSEDGVVADILFLPKPMPMERFFFPTLFPALTP